MAIAITLKDYLDSKGVRYDVIEHPYAVTSMRTAFEAHIPGEDIAKGVVLRDGDGYVLAVVPATHQVQLGKLRKKYNRYLSLAEEKDLSELFDDCSVGAVPPIGMAYGVDVICDHQLSGHDDIYFEAGDHTDLIHMNGREFQSLMNPARHGDFSRHM